MLSSRFCTLLAIGTLMILSPSDWANAQIVRRFAGGGVQVNAPLVRVNVGPYGATSVRAPFVAVDSPGRTFVGRRWRLMAQPRNAPPSHNTARGTRGTSQQAAAPTPDRADVDALPYPTAGELTAMKDAVLVETLRQMMARFHYRLSLLNTGEGWQSYLVLSRDILGSPGAPPETAHFDAVQKVLPRYRSVQDDPQYAKISALPSFVATFAALQETDRRFDGFAKRNLDRPSVKRPQEKGPLEKDSLERGPLEKGPQMTDPNRGEPTPKETPKETPTEDPLEVLPTPTPAVVPNATRGERSILKRK